MCLEAGGVGGNWGILEEVKSRMEAGATKTKGDEGRVGSGGGR